MFDALDHSPHDPAAVARATASAVIDRFEVLKGSRSLAYCFWLLARLASGARGGNFTSVLAELGIHSEGIQSGVSFVREVARAAESGLRLRAGPPLFDRMAELTLRDVLTAHVAGRSHFLFGSGVEQVENACREASTEQRFGRLTRDFFGRLMSRVIRYVTDKELAGHTGPGRSLATPGDALRLQQSLDRYCRESAEIVEEYTGGWFSKHHWQTNGNIPEEEAGRFTAYALEKLAMELWGERV